MTGMVSAADICDSKNLIRSNYYSDTYRAVFPLEGKTEVRDVCHISIPFTPEKETAFMARFNVAEDELDRYYREFGRNLAHGIRINERIKALKNRSLDMSVVYPVKIVTARKQYERGSDIYIITGPSDALTDSQVMSDRGATLHNLLNLGLRLLQTAKVLNENGIYLGTVDPESVRVTTQDGRVLIRTGDFRFSGTSGDGPSGITQDVGPFAEKGFADSAQPSAAGDIYSICSFLWTVLDGRHYADGPDLSRFPRYISSDFARELKRGMQEGESARKDVMNAVREALKTVPDGFISFASSACMKRAERALEEYRRKAAGISEDDDEDEPEPEEEISDGRRVLNALKSDLFSARDREEETDEERTGFLDRLTKRQAVLDISALALSGALLCTAAFYVGKYRGGQTPAAVAAEDTADTSVVMELSASADDDIEIPPLPAASVEPIHDSEIPVMTLDTEYDWFRSEYPADEFCGILFTDTYSMWNPTIESWNFYLGESELNCHVFRREESDRKLKYGPEGDKVLVIEGNGSGRIKVKMTQEQLSQYLGYKFTYAVLNGLTCLRSTGSTPFTAPVETPAPTVQVPDDDAPEEQAVGRDTAYPGYSGGNSNYSGGGYTGGGQNQEIIYEEEITEISTTVHQTEDWGGETEIRNYSITASNNNVKVGRSITLKLTGDWNGTISVESSDAGIASVSDYPDANGYYRINGIRPGVVLITASCPDLVQDVPSVTITVQ